MSFLCYQCSPLVQFDKEGQMILDANMAYPGLNRVFYSVSLPFDGSRPVNADSDEEDLMDGCIVPYKAHRTPEDTFHPGNLPCAVSDLRELLESRLNISTRLTSILFDVVIVTFCQYHHLELRQCRFMGSSYVSSCVSRSVILQGKDNFPQLPVLRG